MSPRQHSDREEVEGSTAEVHKTAGCRVLAGVARMATALNLEYGRYPSSEVLEVVGGSLQILAGIGCKTAEDLLGPGWQVEAEVVEDTVPGPDKSHKTGVLGNLTDLNVAGTTGMID